MTYEVRLFGEIASSQDSIVGNTAPLGELSTYSLSFSSKKTEINDANYPDVSGVVFSCLRDNVEQTALPTNAVASIMSVMDKLVNRITTTMAFADQISDVFPSIYTSMEYSDFITYNGRTLPGYLKWEETLDGDLVTFHLWTADVIFRQQYDLYEIRVIPPVPNLGDLRESDTSMLAALDAYTEEAKLEDIEAARDNDAMTKLAGLTLKWVSPVNGATFNLTWRLLTIGAKGLERVNQLQAVRDYITDTYGDFSEGWGDIFPELNVNTTLTLLPLWNQVALQSSGSVEYVHSPVVRIEQFYEGMTKRTGERPNDALAMQLDYAQSLYKSIGFMAYTEDNGANPVSFSELYPDFSLVSVNDINLNRLKSATRDAVSKIETGLRLAESYVAGEVLPVNFWLESEEHLEFICYVTNGVGHRIATRASYLV